MCNMTERRGEDDKAPLIQETPQLLNPFVHRVDISSTYDKFKLVFMSVLVVPIRVLGIILCMLFAYLFASAGLYGVTKEELREKPMSGWRRQIRWYMGFMGRMMMRCFGFHWVKQKGRMASKAEAPILVAGPHSSFFDAFIIFWSQVPCLVNRIENLQLPLFGKYINYTQPVYVWREDPNSRQNTIQEIKRRATSEQNWPQVVIFPEGTCTNRSCLITFKPGAFYPGVPIQPVVIRYNNRVDSLTWTWDGPGALKMLWITLCQFHNNCEIEYLPVYTPSEEEKNDAKLYAHNVRQVMADALGIPVADYTYDDCRLMHKAKLKNLPCQTGLIEFQKLRHRLGLNLKNVEEELMSQYADIAISDGQITLSDFSKYLGIPESEPALVDLFKLYDKDNSNTIDFREYLVGYCQYAKPANTEETLRWAFKLFDRGGKGHITDSDLEKALKASLDITTEEASRIFKQTDLDNKGYITYDDFKDHAMRKPEYAKIFLTYQESIKNGTRVSKVHLPPPGKTKAD
ncbi:lysophosphatidylcholine acyltransferase isoform X2 [Oratosquilla oratoria]|uniref:lysophosphatidylcholine acyltransferase isoform X2 n=1 Tax=Oratosquilla oratoria TaxID=337810 RepID=UPI003F768A17